MAVSSQDKHNIHAREGDTCPVSTVHSGIESWNVHCTGGERNSHQNNGNVAFNDQINKHGNWESTVPTRG